MGVPNTCVRLLFGSRPLLQSLVADVGFVCAPLRNMSRQEYGRQRDFPYRRGRGRGAGRGGGGRGFRGGFGGPPRGLSGREIGMYYKNKSLERRKEREKNEVGLLSSIGRITCGNVLDEVCTAASWYDLVFLTPSSACCGVYRPSSGS